MFIINEINYYCLPVGRKQHFQEEEWWKRNFSTNKAEGQESFILDRVERRLSAARAIC